MEFQHYRTWREEREFHNRMFKVRNEAAIEVERLREQNPDYKK